VGVVFTMSVAASMVTKPAEQTAFEVEKRFKNA
jgi:hypothetical protein